MVSNAVSVIIKGDGIAAVCAARLLGDAGVGITSKTAVRPKLPAILLGQQTQHLLHEIFRGEDGARELFTGSYPITRRIVLWGDAKLPAVLPHAGLVASENTLLQRLWRLIPSKGELYEAPEGDETWTIRTSIDCGVESLTSYWNCGMRRAHVAEVKLSEIAEPNSCWIESLEAGWLFLLSVGEGRATLIAVGDGAQSLLERSRLIARLLDSIVAESEVGPCYPRFRRAFVEGREITCGTAAIAFDPLCGEGTGNAAREAFLAAAFVRAASAGGDIDALGHHYCSRLLYGFRRHLEICLQFYRSGGIHEFWKAESDFTKKGIATVDEMLRRLPPSRYRLEDRRLIFISV